MMPFSVTELDEGIVLAIGEDDDGEAEFLQAVSSLPHLADAIYDHFPDFAGMIASKVLFEAAKFGEPLVLGDVECRSQLIDQGAGMRTLTHTLLTRQQPRWRRLATGGQRQAI